MPSIAFTIQKRTELAFTLALPQVYTPLNIDVVEEATSDILAHIDFRYGDNTLVLNQKLNERWGREVSHKVEYPRIMSGKIVIRQSFVDVVIGDQTFTKKTARDLFGTSLRIFADFRHVVLEEDENPLEAFARRWPVLVQHENRTWLTSRLSTMPTAISDRAGLSGVIAFNGDNALLEKTVAALHEALDEVIIGIYDTTSVNIDYLNRLQSRYFNVRYHLIDHLQQDDNSVYKAYFLNGVLAGAAFRNVIFIDPFADTNKIRDSILERRLRIRRDHFAVLQKDDRGLNYNVMAMSLRPFTYFLDEDVCSVPSQQDFALRNIELLPAPLLGAGMDWSIKVDGYLDDHGQLTAEPVVSMRGYLDQYKVPKRPRIVFMIVSCVKNRHKQEAIRQTWAKDLDEANIEYVFIEGHPALAAPIELEDRLLLDCPDTYEYLSYKIYKGFQAVVDRYEADYVFKIDDDCICNVEKFLEVDFRNEDYLGTNMISGSMATLDWHRKAVMNGQLGSILFKPNHDVNWFDGQGGYILSRKAIDIITATDVADFGHMLEDYAVGRALHEKVTMRPRLSCRFTSIREGHIHYDEDYRNTIIMDVSSSEKMSELHQKFRDENQSDRQSRAGINVVISER